MIRISPNHLGVPTRVPGRLPDVVLILSMSPAPEVSRILILWSPWNLYNLESWDYKRYRIQIRSREPLAAKCHQPISLSFPLFFHIRRRRKNFPAFYKIAEFLSFPPLFFHIFQQGGNSRICWSLSSIVSMQTSHNTCTNRREVGVDFYSSERRLRSSK